MNIKEEIIYEIVPSNGSKNRVVRRVCDKLRCSEYDVDSSIAWLVNKGYIEELWDITQMTGSEKDYFKSDSCAILRILKRYNETEYLNEELIRKEAEDKLSIKDKFDLYLKKMANDSMYELYHLPNGYDLYYEEDNLLIKQSSEQYKDINIYFNHVGMLYYDEKENKIFYQYDGKYFTMEFIKSNDKICVNNHITLG